MRAFERDTKNVLDLAAYRQACNANGHIKPAREPRKGKLLAKLAISPLCFVTQDGNVYTLPYAPPPNRASLFKDIAIFTAVGVGLALGCGITVGWIILVIHGLSRAGAGLFG